jgi:tetratricopeptide (TPR) repeat protein
LLVSVAVWPVELARTVRHRLAAEFARGPVAISRIDAALVQHPADAYLLRVRAAAALAQRQPDTLRWVGFALQRAPASGATLLLLADTLAHRGTVAQALGVLKQVLGVNPGMVDEVARRATAWAPDDPSVIVPQGRGRLEALVALSRHARERSQALSWLARAVEQPGAPSETRIELALLALSSSDDQCQAAVDEPCARFAHEQRQQVPVSAGTRGVELDAALAWHEGKHEQAFAALQQRCPRNPSGTDCLRRLMAYGRALDVGRQVKAIDAFLSAACGSDAACASAEAEAGQALLARGERRLALVHLVHAAVLRPNEAAWRHVAELARDSDELGVLRQALSGLASLGLPVPAEFTDAVDRMQRERLLPP